jgi:hypothetical protein
MRRIAIDLFLITAIGVVLGLVGPFGSAAMSPGPRLFFWVAFTVAGYLIFRPVSAVARWAAEETRLPQWLAVVLVALVASLPLAAAIAFALGGMAVTDFWFGSRFPLLYGQVAAVGIAIHILMMLLRPEVASRQPVEELEPLAAAPSLVLEQEAGTGFLRRLPPALGRDLLSLQMQDHYLQVQTALGSTLLLMRFRDAVAELEGVGIQVHRSWWVAYSAMEALDRDGRSIRLRLRGGSLVPVSRACLPAVREALGRAGFDSPVRSYKSPVNGGQAARALPAED